MAYAAPTVTMTLKFPGDALEPSYVDMYLSAPSPVFGSATTLDTWCLDRTAKLDIDQSYTGALYSSNELGLIRANVPTLANSAYLGNLDNINWLLNYYDGTNVGISWGEVQSAIWQLMGQSYAGSLPTLVTQVDKADVDNLVTMALAHDGYLAGAGQNMGVVVDTIAADGSHHQPLIVEVKAAQLGDFVWEDKNANGIQDTGEVGIAGAAVQLVRDLDGDGKFTSANEILATTTTDSTGHYSFLGLTPGLDYQVLFATPTGFSAASPRQADGSSTSGTNSDGAVSDHVVLAPGENNVTLDSGFYKYASLGDKVWEDKNGDGKQDPNEPGVAGVRVELYTCATATQPEKYVTFTTTLADGSYLFDKLVPGTYHVKFIAPTGTTFTTIDVGSDDRIDSDANASGITGCYTLNSGDHNTTVDAGIKYAALGDRVWYDSNGNGVQDSGELGKGGVTVNLLNTAGTVIGTQVTDANGNYLFEHLLAGDYCVQFLLPGGRSIFTDANVGNDALDSDADKVTGKTGLYTLSAGERNLTVDAGILCAPNVGDRVWIDSNANGIQDGGEVGVAGVKVNLIGAGVDGLFGTADDTLRSTTTNASGNYLFEVVKTGQYKVQFETPAGYGITTTDVGSNDVIDSDGTLVKASGLGNLIVNGSFEADSAGGYWIAYNSLTGWNAVNSNIDLIQANYFTTGGASGTNIVELDSAPIASNLAYGISQAISTTAGQVYTLGFDAAMRIGTAAATNVFNVYWNDTLVATVSPGSTTFAHNAFTVTGTGGNDVLKFLVPAGPNDGVGAELDNVTLTSTGLATTAAFTVGCDDDLTRDLGLTTKLLAAYGDRAWLDANANGVQDAGEVGLAGVKVTLYNYANTVVGTTTTDVNGNYLFTGLIPDRYYANFSAPTGYVITGQDKGGNDATDSDIYWNGNTIVYANLAAGQTDRTWDAGYYQLASLGDRVWNDTNGNGKQDPGETGHAGVRVELYTCATATTAEAFVTFTTTDANGNYLFSQLTPGTYHVKVIAPSGTTFTTMDVGADGTDSDANASGITGCYTLASGENNTTVDAGLVPIATASYGDRAWIDANANGVQDAGEVGLAGVKVTLYNYANAVVGTTTTDANGNYLFTGLVPDRYYANFVAPTGYILTGMDKGGNDATDSDVASWDGFTKVYANLAAGQADLTWDAGFYQLASYGDRAWIDANANGVQDAGEVGLAGVKVTLYNYANAVVGTATTDANGNYLFTGLVPDRYYANFAAPTGYILTGMDKGGNDATDSDVAYWDGFTKVYANLSSGQVDRTWDAGYYQLASMGDRVWLDANVNGQQDAGEVGVAGVTVKLLDSAGNVLATQTTNTSGNYLFSSLTPGDYSVQFAAPSGKGFTTADSGADASDSDANAITGKTGIIHLVSGEQNLSVDAGVVLASLGDRVWYDTNKNGIQDAGEGGVANATVYLTDTSSGQNILAKTTTDANGYYHFYGLDAGSYRVKFVVPGNYAWTKQDVGSNNAVDSDADWNTGMSGVVKLAAGEQNNTIDAGIVPETLGCVDGLVFRDNDHSSTRSTGDDFVAGVMVRLQQVVGTTVTTIETAFTDYNGDYHFANLADGTYRVVFTKHPGTDYFINDHGVAVALQVPSWAPTGVGNANVDSDAYSTTDQAVTANFKIVNGSCQLHWDAGTTPIVLDLDGNGIHTLSRFDSTATFDLLGTGHAIQSGWISSGDAFLAVDTNGNGKIDNVSELFGGTAKGDGFAKLASYDLNGDGTVDASEAAQGHLMVWRDSNGNHVTDAGELMTLAQAGIDSLKATFTEKPEVDEQGNLHLERSSATLSNGSSIDMTDVYFAVSADDAAAAGLSGVSMSDLLGGNDAALDGLLGTVGTSGPTVAPQAVADANVDKGNDVAEFIHKLTNLHDLDQHAMVAMAA